jgi:hypothetical protein
MQRSFFRKILPISLILLSAQVKSLAGTGNPYPCFHFMNMAQMSGVLCDSVPDSRQSPQIKEVPKSRKQEKPVALTPTPVTVKPIRVIKPKIIKPVIKIN